MPCTPSAAVCFLSLSSGGCCAAESAVPGENCFAGVRWAHAHFTHLSLLRIIHMYHKQLYFTSVLSYLPLFVNVPRNNTEVVLSSLHIFWLCDPSIAITTIVVITITHYRIIPGVAHFAGHHILTCHTSHTTWLMSKTPTCVITQNERQVFFRFEWGREEGPTRELRRHCVPGHRRGAGGTEERGESYGSRGQTQRHRRTDNSTGRQLLEEKKKVRFLELYRIIPLYHTYVFDTKWNHLFFVFFFVTGARKSRKCICTCDACVCSV